MVPTTSADAIRSSKLITTQPLSHPYHDHSLRLGPFHEWIDDRHTAVVLAIGEIL